MDILKQSLAIALVFGLLWLALRLVRKRSGMSAGFLSGRPGRGPMESLGKLVLTPQHSLHIVRAGGQELILAAHPRGITVLGDSARAAVHPARGLE